MTHHDGDWAIRLRTDDPWSVSLVADLWRHPETEPPNGPGLVCCGCPPAPAGSAPRPRARAISWRRGVRSAPRRARTAIGQRAAGAEGRWEGRPPADPAGCGGRLPGERAGGRRCSGRIVLPAAGAALLWSLLYLVSAAAAPARPTVGAVHAAMMAALAQFMAASLLAWCCARYRRLRRPPGSTTGR